MASIWWSELIVYVRDYHFITVYSVRKHNTEYNTQQVVGQYSVRNNIPGRERARGRERREREKRYSRYWRQTECGSENNHHIIMNLFTHSSSSVLYWCSFILGQSRRSERIQTSLVVSCEGKACAACDHGFERLGLCAEIRITITTTTTTTTMTPTADRTWEMLLLLLLLQGINQIYTDGGGGCTLLPGSIQDISRLISVDGVGSIRTTSKLWCFEEQYLGLFCDTRQHEMHIYMY